MKAIDEARLERDVEYRYRYLAEFIGFGPDDHGAIQASAMYLGPIIPQLVEATYEKLMQYDATARHFLPRQSGYEGPLPGGLADLASSPQIQFRKEHLSRYFMQILGRSFDGKMALYLDMVGKIHTPRAGSTEIDVPLVQMNALMGLLSDVLTGVIGQLPLDPATQVRTIRAFQKFLWIQNDFITRHYGGAKSASAGEDSPRGHS
ncbi:MAG: protoglobin family protein [Gemmataceae bacterium]